MPLTRWTLACTALTLAACTAPTPTAPTGAAPAAGSAARSAAVFPEVVDLPNAFQPEGIAAGRGTTFYVGSLANGAVWRGDARTGTGAIVVPGAPGRVVVGIEYDNRRDRLFAAGGATGRAFVFDASTGATLATYQLATGGGTFVNDVVVTKDAAYFTDSFRAVLYRVPLARNGALADPGAVQVLPLTGDFALRPGFNANGIDATPNGKELVIVQSGTGFLFRVDPETGVTTRIDLGGATLPNGDGILLEGRTLYVVQNQLNRVAVVRLAPDLASGTVEGFITDADFRVPTTVARIGNALYLPNARFGTPPGPNVDYEVVRVER